jgi:hypothetical protein
VAAAGATGDTAAPCSPTPTPVTVATANRPAVSASRTRRQAVADNGTGVLVTNGGWWPTRWAAGMLTPVPLVELDRRIPLFAEIRGPGQPGTGRTAIS